MFIYPIYNHNWRNINTIYLYNKTSIKRNILTIKQNISEVGLRTYQHPGIWEQDVITNCFLDKADNENPGVRPNQISQAHSFNKFSTQNITNTSSPTATHRSFRKAHVRSKTAIKFISIFDRKLVLITQQWGIKKYEQGEIIELKNAETRRRLTTTVRSIPSKWSV
jgi:hypothetical protein